MANIDDVARIAGVSRSTVSRVLRDSSKVKKNTRDKILAVIEELNYSPNTAARSLASKKSQNLGIVTSYALNDPFYSIIAEEIFQVCEGKKYGSLFVLNRIGHKHQKDPIDLLNGKVDGFIFLGEAAASAEQLKKLASWQVPVAVFKNGISVEGAVTVDIDNYKGGYEAVEYLISQGHRKIACVHGRTDYYETIERLAGYKAALEHFECCYDPDHMYCANFSYQEAYALAGTIIDSGVTAVFCANDMMGHGLVQGLRHLGADIPGQISVLGFDGITFNNYVSDVELSTVKQPLKEMGIYLAETIIDRVENEGEATGKIFDVEIQAGRTVQALSE